ncbi:MAG TPA: hypothetical protein PLF42_05180, partial [Anaerolineales bacterium]|nr:hypothetical protein [Anaerolineales bacterium]
MSISQAPLPNGKSTGGNLIARLWRQLIEPPPSLTSVADRRRAQLLSIITLILSLLFIVALIYGPSSYGAFLILTGITLISYALRRTRYYRAGNYLFTYAFTALAYMRIFMGTAESIEAAVVSTVHISLVFSSVLLSRRGFVGLVVFATLATFIAPLYTNIPGEPEIIGRVGGVVLVIGAILYGITVFRENLEKEQGRELSDANLELEDIKTGLEKRIEERTLELQTASLQAQDRADRLQNITDISHEISSNTALKTEDLLARMTQTISKKLGYYHVGIFLLDEKREYAVLHAANSDGGRRML